MPFIIFMGLTLFSAKSEAMFSPHFDLKLGTDNQVQISAANSLNRNLECTYIVRYFENRKRHQRVMGSTKIASNAQKNIMVLIDPFIKVTNVRASVECDD